MSAATGESHAQALAQSGAAWPSERYAWFVVVVLLGAYTLSFIDRQILTLMVGPIRASLGITDTQFSLLHGLAFAILYTFLGLPFGRLVDRSSRRAIAAAGVFGWSLMTALCAVARSFPQLFLARIGVGIGEATLSPAAYSLLSDYFPPCRRTRALSVYALGISGGAGLAYMAGGAVVDLAARAETYVLPLLGPLQPWQVVFLIVGIPGMLFALLVAFIREPARRNLSAMVTATAAAPAAPELAGTWKFLAAHKATFTMLFTGLAFMTALSHGVFAWVPTYFIRHFGWTPGEFGLTFGALVLTLGSAGIVCGGWLAEHFESRGRSDATMRVAAIGSTLSVPLAFLAPLQGSAAAAIVAFGLVQFFIMMPWGVAGAAIQAVTPNEYRGQLTALYLFSINLIGLGLGPTVVALFTDHVFRSDAAIGWSLAATVLVFGPAGCVLLWCGLRAFRASAMSARAWVDR
jgi:MFS family permease